jgi:hypothetical protein
MGADGCLSGGQLARPIDADKKRFGNSVLGTLLRMPGYTVYLKHDQGVHPLKLNADTVDYDLSKGIYVFKSGNNEVAAFNSTAIYGYAKTESIEKVRV